MFNHQTNLKQASPNWGRAPTSTPFVPPAPPVASVPTPEAHTAPVPASAHVQLFGGMFDGGARPATASNTSGALVTGQKPQSPPDGFAGFSGQGTAPLGSAILCEGTTKGPKNFNCHWLFPDGTSEQFPSDTDVSGGLPFP